MTTFSQNFESQFCAVALDFTGLDFPQDTGQDVQVVQSLRQLGYVYESRTGWLEGFNDWILRNTAASAENFNWSRNKWRQQVGCETFSRSFLVFVSPTGSLHRKLRQWLATSAGSDYVHDVSFAVPEEGMPDDNAVDHSVRWVYISCPRSDTKWAKQDVAKISEIGKVAKAAGNVINPELDVRVSSVEVIWHLDMTMVIVLSCLFNTLAVALVSMLFFPESLVLVAVLSIAVVNLSVVGFMAMVGISLSPVTAIWLILGIGLGVDPVLHMLYIMRGLAREERWGMTGETEISFVLSPLAGEEHGARGGGGGGGGGGVGKSNKDKGEQREEQKRPWVSRLRRDATPVLSGSTSTCLTISFLLLSPSSLFVSFSSIGVCTMILGIGHGVFALPLVIVMATVVISGDGGSGSDGEAEEAAQAGIELQSV